MKFLRGESNFPFIGRMWLFIGISVFLTLLSLLSIATKGINFGIDFAGGYEIQLKFPRAVSESDIRHVIEPLQVGDARVQRYGNEQDNEYLILMRGQHAKIDKEAIKAGLEQAAGGASNLTGFAIAESGERINATFASPVSEDKLRSSLTSLQIKSITRGEREDRPDYTIELVSISDQISSALIQELKLDPNTPIISRVEFVGPQVGGQLRQQGFMALVYALGFILVYIAIRFDMFFAPGAIISLIHDVIILLGVFSFFQIEFNLPIIAALLTLVGYSLNDTIVVFDRIREQLGKVKGRDLRTTVNAAINQTLSRTLLTSGFTLLAVIALLVFGGETIRAFSLALCVGIVFGTYSSIAIASPAYILFKERYGKVKKNPNGSAVSAA